VVAPALSFRQSRARSGRQNATSSRTRLASLHPTRLALRAWAQAAERKLSNLAEALRYIIKRRAALTRFATDARLEPDNNIAENAIRCIAWEDATGCLPAVTPAASAAAMYSILQTAKLNGVHWEAYLTETLAKIAAGNPISRISELMPSAFQSLPSETAA
jgi:hypothetical protein